jgi:hypothetical protein
MLAVVDSDYKFLFVDVGAEGRAADSRIWKQTQFFQDMEHEDNKLCLPNPAPVPGLRGHLPYFFVGDDAFALGVHLMKPFPSSKLNYQQRIFNYRISRCRRIVENAFGILSCRFRLFLRQQDMEPAGVQILTMTAVALHNFLRIRCGETYMPRGMFDSEDTDYNNVLGQWRSNQQQLDSVTGHQRVGHRSASVKLMRDDLAKWCLSKEGEVSWQYRKVPKPVDF